MIYDLSEKYKVLLEMMNEEGADEQAINDTLLSLEGELYMHVESLVKAIKNAEAEAEAIKAEASRLSERAKARQADAARLKQKIIMLMDSADEKTMKSDLFTVTVGKGRESVDILDQKLIPDEYMKVEVIQSPMKADILKQLNEGNEVPGAAVKVGNKFLTIK